MSASLDQIVADCENLRQLNGSLRGRIAELEEENVKLKERLDACAKLSSQSAFKFFVKAFFSFGLAKKFRDYGRASSVTDPFPSPQTENLLAGIVNRIFIGKTVPIIIAAVSPLILIVQVWIAYGQNQLLSNQIRYQKDADREKNMVEFAKYMYDKTCNDKGECTPINNQKIRGMALLAYIAADRAQKGVRYVNLDGAMLSGIELPMKREVNFVTFRKANLSGFSAPSADLTASDFEYADLSSANLSGAKVNGASFKGARLAGANLEGISGYEEGTFQDACVDEKTRVSEEIKKQLRICSN
ncbi:pentapeptide repeat-containing protein [Azospirillum sp. SYSU D00513]|uniref:pentapeptide repeat-containing protein n=1 Tax=Azospirillum sp. SYSU D00513 TaxID=2812561 RepID=UPI001A977098|nr:pentapeptide repeat-containing protein [Azospirillum sp. SYSU D00513]